MFARDGILLSDFHDTNDAFRFSYLVKTNTLISKTAVTEDMFTSDVVLCASTNHRKGDADVKNLISF